MKLWLLEAREDLPDDKSNPWKPWYDKAFSFVVRAETEEQARRLATENGGDEVHYSSYFGSGDKNAWLDAKYSTCVELTGDGEAQVIIRNYSSA